MVKPFSCYVVGLISAVITLAKPGAVAHAISPFSKTFIHNQYAPLKLRDDLDWEPDLAKCPAQCAILEQAFGSCVTSKCICTDAVAAGYSTCMACSIELNQFPGMLSDAQQSQDTFESNCGSDGFSVAHVVVTPEAATSVAPALNTPVNAPPPAATSQQTTNLQTVYPWQPTPTTVTNGNTVVWYGGGSFGMSVGSEPQTVTGNDFPPSSGSTVFPGVVIGSSSPTTQAVPPSGAASAGSGASAGDTANPTDSALNPQASNNAQASTYVSVLSLVVMLPASALLHVYVL